jgi:hypothetical protein
VLLSREGDGLLCKRLDKDRFETGATRNLIASRKQKRFGVRANMVQAE